MPNTRHAFIALALVACCAASAALARPGLVEIQGRALPRLSLSEGEALQGSYRLEDGRELTVSQRGRRLFASIDGRELPLRALSAYELQSIDGTLGLNFVATANGSVHAVRVSQSRRG